MEIKIIPKKTFDFFKKYRHAVLILLIGLVLIAIPGKKTESGNVQSTVSVTNTAEPSVEQKLAAILKRLEGAGDVQVMLTVAQGEKILYQTNDDISTTGDTSNRKTNTVTVTDANRNQSGLINQTNPPIYLGAVVVCQGADNPTVKLSIVDAVSKLTGLGANRICVLRMK